MGHSSSNSLSTNFIYNTLYEVLLVIIPLLTAPYLSRVLGAQGIGSYSYTYNIASTFVLVSMLGVKNYGNRSIAAVRDNQDSLNVTFSEIYSLQLLVSFAVLVVYIIYALFIAADRTLALVWLPYIISATLDINWLFFGLERFRITVTRNFVIKMLSFMLIFMLVRQPEDLWKYAALSSMSFLVSQIILWRFVRGVVSWVRPNAKSMRKHVKPMLILFVPIVAISLYTTLDKILLGYLSSMEQVGYFENASKVPNVSYLFVGALGTVTLPRMSNLFARGNSERAFEYLSISMWFALCMSTALAFGAAAISPEFVPRFFGSEFAPAIVGMQLLSLNQPFKAWANVVRTQYLLPTGRDGIYVESVAIGAAVNIVLDLLLIPSYGASGSAVATTAAEIVVCVWQTARVRRNLPIARWLKLEAPYLAFGLVMWACIRGVASYLPLSTAGLVIEIFTGVVSYTALCMLYLVITRDAYLIYFVRTLGRKLRTGLLRS